MVALSTLLHRSDDTTLHYHDLRPVLIFDQSQTWTPEWSGDVVVHVIGGGAGGATTGGTHGKGWGAAAGGYARKRLNVTAGTSYAITVGAGGAGSASGANGGDSAFVGSGHQLTAYGGGASGGTALGGDVNVTGGGRQHVSQDGGAGGASVGLIGTGYAGGASISDYSGGSGASIWGGGYDATGLAGIYRRGGVEYDLSSIGRALGQQGFGAGGQGLIGAAGAAVPSQFPSAGGPFAGGGAPGSRGGYGGGGASGGSGGSGLVMIEIYSRTQE